MAGCATARATSWTARGGPSGAIAATITSRSASAALETSIVRLRGVRLHAGAEAVDAVKVRYRAPAVRCTLAGDELRLGEPVHGVAPGQLACLLRGDVVVGCATIVG